MYFYPIRTIVNRRLSMFVNKPQYLHNLRIKNKSTGPRVREIAYLTGVSCFTYHLMALKSINWLRFLNITFCPIRSYQKLAHRRSIVQINGRYVCGGTRHFPYDELKQQVIKPKTRPLIDTRYRINLNISFTP